MLKVRAKRTEALRQMLGSIGNAKSHETGEWYREKFREFSRETATAQVIIIWGAPGIIEVFDMGSVGRV